MKRIKQTKKIKLPASFRPLFWSYRFQDLQQQEDAPLIIKQVLLYGDLKQLQWMTRVYGRKKIAAVLSRTPESELRPSSVEFAKAIFNITSMPHVRSMPYKRS